MHLSSVPIGGEKSSIQLQTYELDDEAVCLVGCLMEQIYLQQKASPMSEKEKLAALPRRKRNK